MKKDDRKRQSQPDKPFHQSQESLFTWSSGFSNFSGLVNLGFLLLSIGGFRLLLENFIKYGIRIDPIQWYIALTGHNYGEGQGEGFPSLTLILYTLVAIFICFMVEKGLSVKRHAEKIGMLIHAINLVVFILVPVVIMNIHGHNFSIISASIMCFGYSNTFMKLWSYIHVNMWCRHDTLKSGMKTQNSSDNINEVNGNKKDHHTEFLVKYPQNLHLKDLFYFLCAPTLCYELNFPRKHEIRKQFLLKRTLEVIIGVNVVLALVQQWMIPSVQNSLIPFSNMDLPHTTERLLKLAVPNHLVWLCFFYLTFHSFLNLLGEITQFADRNFYSDWWNADCINTFWRCWNIPVHRWCVRHVYVPIITMGFSQSTASNVVFFVSAIFHEYLVSIPLRIFKIWAFMGMMAQIPLARLSNHVKERFGPRWGNIIVWSSLIIGQPLAIMMYYHDYIVTYYREI
ncbi:O-acyltransferase [Sergentomyia squamirostris]